MRPANEDCKLCTTNPRCYEGGKSIPMSRRKWLAINEIHTRPPVRTGAVMPQDSKDFGWSCLRTGRQMPMEVAPVASARSLLVTFPVDVFDSKRSKPNERRSARPICCTVSEQIASISLSVQAIAFRAANRRFDASIHMALKCNGLRQIIHRLAV